MCTQKKRGSGVLDAAHASRFPHPHAAETCPQPPFPTPAAHHHLHHQGLVQRRVRPHLGGKAAVAGCLAGRIPSQVVGGSAG